MSILEELQQEMQRSYRSDCSGLLTIRPANDWVREAKARPDPRSWFHGMIVSNENTVIFAASNVGKSILAVQIAEEISKEQKVLYLDLEMSDKQFQMRYTDGDTVHEFPTDFLRAEINPEYLLDSDLEEGILYSIERAAESGIKFFIIDNITFVCMNAERSEAAGEFMKKVIFLKQKYQLTIIAIAHTPKRYSNAPLSQYDLAGSARLINLFDAGIAIGCSVQDKRLRYIKQVKTRTGNRLYDDDHVAVCELTTEGGWLHFNIVGCESEYKHLVVPIGKESKDELREKVKVLLHRGLSIKGIEKELNISHAMAQRLRKDVLEKEGISSVSPVSYVSADTLDTDDTYDTADIRTTQNIEDYEEVQIPPS